MPNSIVQAVRAGNVRQTSPGQGKWVNLYLGTGRLGGCFARHGLQWPHLPVKHDHTAFGVSRTSLMHHDHWTVAAHGMHFYLPACNIEWQRVPVVQRCEQELDLFSGLLRTELVTEEGAALRVDVQSNPSMPDVLFLQIRWTGLSRPDAVCVRPVLRYGPESYDFACEGTFNPEPSAAPGLALGEIRMGTARTLLVVRSFGRSTASVEQSGQGPRVELPAGSGCVALVVGLAGAGRRDQVLSQVLACGEWSEAGERAAKAWTERWGNAFVSLPDARAQELWARAAYYLLASFQPGTHAPPAPNGWTCNLWPFHFPQDISYIHPAMLRLGHFDLARGVVEFYRSRLEETAEVSHRLYGLPGVCWLWEFPVGERFADGFLHGAPPNPYQFEIHNAAYPARMAFETASFLGDPDFWSKIAWPVIRESARFYGATCQRGNDGRWGIHVIPSMGQDEFGGADAPDYLCALYSARYTLRRAVEVAERLGASDPDLPRWRSILHDGIALDRLVDPATGIRVSTAAVLGTNWIRKQKHPVQLNPLVFAPDRDIDAPTLAAWKVRDDICDGIRRSVSYGWTLCAMLLASVRLGDADSFAELFERLFTFDLMDEQRIQLVETSSAIHGPYYITSHGLVLQALNDLLVEDPILPSRTGSALPRSWAGAGCSGLRTSDGRTVNVATR